jgi:hypothetical protein
LAIAVVTGIVFSARPLRMGRHTDVVVRHDPGQPAFAADDRNDAAVELPHQAGGLVQGAGRRTCHDWMAHDFLDSHLRCSF